MLNTNNMIWRVSLMLSSTLLLLAGCASGPSAPAVPSVFKHEQVSNQSVGNTAILKTVDGEYTAAIGRCVGGKKSNPNHTIYVADFWQATKYTHYMVDVDSKEARLVPGRYVCAVHCSKGNKSADPMMTLNLRGGTTTTLRCEAVGEKMMKIYHLPLAKTDANYFDQQAELVKAGKLRFVVKDYKQ